MPKRNKASYSCGPCKRLKTKCDHDIPCGRCVKNNRVEQCLADPPRMFDKFKELTAPNATFKRVRKTDPRPLQPHDAAVFQGSGTVGGGTAIGNFEVHNTMITQPDRGAERQHENNNKPETLIGIPHNGDVPRYEYSSQMNHIRSSSQHSLSNHPPLPFPPAPPQSRIPQYGHYPNQISGPGADSGQRPPQISNYVDEYNTSQISQPPPFQQHSVPSEVPFFEQIKALPWYYHEGPPDKTFTILKLLRLELDTLANHEVEIEMKTKILQLLPSSEVCRALKDYYLEYVDYIYHPLHHPTFNRQFDEFVRVRESAEYDKMDLLWMVVLLQLLALSLIHLPQYYLKNPIYQIFSNPETIKFTSRLWASISKQLFTYVRNDNNPRLLELQFFSLLQLYLYATKQSDYLDSFLAAAIRTAFALNLNKPKVESKTPLETEMRRRLWWDIAGCDTFRALCTGRPPLIRSYKSRVPLPANVNDKDVGDDFIQVSGVDIPTDNSFNIYRAQMMKILNGMFEINQFKADSIEDHELNEDILNGLIEMDIELCTYVSNLPWFFNLDMHSNLPDFTPEVLKFQFHMLHTCICIHRLRFFQNYLERDIPIAWEVCVSTAKCMFNVYKRIRSRYNFNNSMRPEKEFNPLFLAQLHQSFTGSVTQGMVLLMMIKDGIHDDETEKLLFDDLNMFLQDLTFLNESGFILRPDIIEQSFTGLRMLSSFCSNLKQRKLQYIPKSAADRTTDDPNTSDRIVNNLSGVFGGKESTENYLKKCSVDFLVNPRQNSADKTAKFHSEHKKNNLVVSNDVTLYFDYVNQFGTMISDKLPIVNQSIEFLRQRERQLKLEEESEQNQKDQSISNANNDMHINTSVDPNANKSSPANIRTDVNAHLKLACDSGSQIPAMQPEKAFNVRMKVDQGDNTALLDQGLEADPASQRPGVSTFNSVNISTFGDQLSSAWEDLTNQDYFVQEWNNMYLNFHRG
ncbi:hypothetical protein LJB42_002616 [Komagataella kurtzmanii]|nr:hypothetical protein LJB42_002616 [Komagataella kurtzmanii]